MSRVEGVMVEIDWAINPFRGDKFEALWTPAAEVALDYGATSWALLRSQEGGLDFTQLAHFPTKDRFERYWYSEQVAAVRVQCAGLYQVPLLPKFHTIAGADAMARPTASTPA